MVQKDVLLAMKRVRIMMLASNNLDEIAKYKEKLKILKKELGKLKRQELYEKKEGMMK